MALGSSPGSDRTAAITGIAFRLLSRATFHTERREEVQFKDPPPRQEIFVSRIHHRQVPAVTIIPAHCAEGVAREHSATIREGAMEHSRQPAVHRCRVEYRYLRKELQLELLPEGGTYRLEVRFGAAAAARLAQRGIRRAGCPCQRQTARSTFPTSFEERTRSISSQRRWWGGMGRDHGQQRCLP